jgi:hypothetical protein
MVTSGSKATAKHLSRGAWRMDTWPFSADERKSVQALIHYQADKRGVRPSVIERATESFFAVDDLDRLPAHRYEAAIRYLVEFSGVN